MQSILQFNEEAVAVGEFMIIQGDITLNVWSAVGLVRRGYGQLGTAYPKR